jgi:hypothetical protein
MSYYLKFDGVDDRVVFNAAITAPTTSFVWEAQFNAETLQWSNLLINTATSSTQGALWLQQTNMGDFTFIITLDGKARVIYATGINRSSGIVIFRVEWDSTSQQIKIYGNGALLTTLTGYATFPMANMTHIGFSPLAAGEGRFKGDLYYTFFIIDGVENRYDPSASNGAGSILPDTVGTNDGTLELFTATDGAKWFFYGTATAVPGIGQLTVQFEGVAINVADWHIITRLAADQSILYNQTGQSSDASGNISAFATTSGSVGDPVRVEGLSAADAYSFVIEQNLGNIA